MDYYKLMLKQIYKNCYKILQTLKIPFIFSLRINCINLTIRQKHFGRLLSSSTSISTNIDAK